MRMLIRAALTLLTLAGLPSLVRAQAVAAPLPPMPYAANHAPEFVPAPEAAFLETDDIVLGVVSGGIAKAFPAPDLAQHGAVADRLPDGAVSVTWCGVCNTGLVFRADVNGRTLRFQYDYPFSQLRVARVVNDRVGGLRLVILHQPSSDTTTAFDARANGLTLTFEPANEEASVVVDRETRSTWNAYGLCVDGPLSGTQLKPVMLVPQFWFAWSQFRPGTKVFTTR